MLLAIELKVVIEWISQMNKHKNPKKFSPLQWSFSYPIKFRKTPIQILTGLPWGIKRH